MYLNWTKKIKYCYVFQKITMACHCFLNKILKPRIDDLTISYLFIFIFLLIRITQYCSWNKWNYSLFLIYTLSFPNSVFSHLSFCPADTFRTFPCLYPVVLYCPAPMSPPSVFLFCSLSSFLLLLCNTF